MPLRNELSAWLVRVLVAAVLLACSEVLWWSNDPTGYAPGDWPGLALVYLALAAVLLDLLARLTVTTFSGVLVVGGIYGLLNGTLVARTAFADLPLSLVTRPLGLHTLGGGVLAVLILSVLRDGRGIVPVRAAAAAGIGLLSGMWSHSFPQLASNNYPVPDLVTVLLWVAGSAIIIGVLGWLAGRWPVTGGGALVLRPWGWFPVGAVLLVAFWQAKLNSLEAVILGGLLGYLVLLLFMTRGQSYRRGPVLAAGRALNLLAYGMYAALLVGAAGAGYLLPGSVDGPPFQWLTLLLTAFGILWLPGVSVWVGFRAYIRLFREEG